MDTLKKKRKRGEEVPTETAVQKAPKLKGQSELQSTISHLENQILESRRYYNNIASIIGILKDANTTDSIQDAAAISLCRIFSRLLAGRHMLKTKSTPEAELLIIHWLKERYQEYLTEILQWVLRGNASRQISAIEILMRLIKQEANQFQDVGQYDWKHGLFSKLVHAVISLPEASPAYTKFTTYTSDYDDIRHYAVQALILRTEESDIDTSLPNTLDFLSNLGKPPETKSDLTRFYAGAPKDSKHYLYSPVMHKKQAQKAWLIALRLGISIDQRKHILRIMTTQVVPWFINTEQLMDFLTDSYNTGGSISLLALSGVFYLMQEKNLDYPSFYQKLYSLLDWGLLHSKHRSRFFRLLDIFLASTHLPAALVASFIKRLSRLALHAPPAGIVVVIPWIYNMFKRHPACTFMMHRISRSLEEGDEYEHGLADPYDMDEQDPMESNALDSSVWELVTLQSHYHPNVATLARIISEQFTKAAYNLEDFLDYSYSGIIDVELSKSLKKAPVVEYEIPKRIFTEDDSRLGSLIADVRA